jgi:AcrR family transcriptional regulator
MDDDSGTPRYAKGIARREEILDAAHQVFGELGFHGASLRAIAARAGVTHQSLMHYFATKDDLLLAVLRRRDLRLGQHFASPEGLPLEELIALAEDNRAVPGVIELFSTAAGEATAVDHPAHAYYAGFYRDIVASAERALEGRDTAPGYTAEQVSQLVLAVQDGLQLQWLYDRSIDVPGLMRKLVETLVDGQDAPPAVPAAPGVDVASSKD